MKIRVDALQNELGLENRSQLAQWLGIKPQAIYQWGDYLPPLRAYQVVERVPKFANLAEDRAA